MELIDKSALVAEIERRKQVAFGWMETAPNDAIEAEFELCDNILSFINNLEVKEVDLHNNGWIDCTKQMPPETKQTSDTLQGHREWTESDRVLVWDSMYGCSVDVTKNGKWLSEQRGGYKGQVVHGIIAWRPIPEFIA